MNKVPSREELAQAGTLEDLYDQLGRISIGPGWAKSTPSLWPAPKKTFAPARWKYEQARGALDAAGRLINTELAERRNLILFNPAADNGYGTVTDHQTGLMWEKKTPAGSGSVHDVNNKYTWFNVPT